MEYHKYGTRSREKLESCHVALQDVAYLALERCPYDISIIHGFRNEEQQNALYPMASTKMWPDSKHNSLGDNGQPQSEAIDFAPWVSGDIPWDDTHIFAVVAGSFLAAANELGVRLRWGGDWDGDGSTKDQKLQDWGHVEIIL